MITGFEPKKIYKCVDVDGIIFYCKESKKIGPNDFKLKFDAFYEVGGAYALENEVCYIEHETFDKWQEYELC